MNIRSFFLLLVSGVLLLTACVPSLPFLSDDGESEDAVARPVTSRVERPTVKVERGSIIDAVRVLGRVTAETEESLFFKQNGRLKGVYVEYNQPVVAGTLLADLETGNLETSIQNSELSLQDKERDLNKARSQAASGEAEVTLARIAVERAEQDVEEAREALTEAQGGPNAQERAQAETAHANAAARLDTVQDALQRAQDQYAQAQEDLTNFRAGAAVDLKVQRDLALRAAEEAFDAAQARLDHLRSGNPDTQVLSQQANLRAREQALESATQAVNAERTKLIDEIQAEIKVYRAELRTVSLDIEEALEEAFESARQLGSKASAAQAALEEALAALEEARLAFHDAMRLEGDVPAAQRALENVLDVKLAEALATAQTNYAEAKQAGSNVSAAQRALEDVQELIVEEYEERKTALAEYIEERNLQLVVPPLQGTRMAILWASREKARLDLQSATAALDQSRAQASQALPAAQAELEKARFELEQAQQAYADVESDLAKNLTTAELNLNAAQAAVRQAEADLAVAQERWDVVRSGVDPEKLQNAEWNLASMEAALQKAQVNLDQTLINAADAGNVTKLENDLKRARANHQLLLEQLQDARLTAPFDGVIQFIKGKAGESATAYQPIIGLADPRKLIISADLSEDDAAKVALEQVADLTLDAFSSENITGIITKLPTSLVTTQGVIQDRSIRIEVDWPKAGAEIGMLARVNITVQHKDDVLMVPIESVKRSGRRTYVEYMDGDIKRAKNVEIGIQTETHVEILSGLEEGFVILQGQ